MGTRRKLWWVALLYFAEGLPFGLVLSFFPVYFRVHGVSLAEIGALSAIRTPWSAKVFWAPLVDQLGTRRRWIQAALVIVAATLFVLPSLPATTIGTPLFVLLLVFAAAGATQDVAIDAYTIELLDAGEEGVGNGVRVSAYRAALIVAGSALVWLGGGAGWPAAVRAGAVLCLVLAAAVGGLPHVDRHRQAPGEFASTLRAWFARPGALGVFAFVLLYKLGDTAIGPMIRPFWVDSGLSVEEIAVITTTFGVGATVLGALVGGALTSRWGIVRGLWVLGLVHASANLVYAAAAWTGGGRPMIYAASLAESFTGGLGTPPFIALMMRVCDKRQAATQYALVSALFNLPGVLAGSVSGVGAASLGYSAYFALTFLLALPAYALFPWVRRALDAAEPR